MELKQNTAANVMILLVDSADHVSGKTGLTPTVVASKNGGAFAALDAEATVTEVANGWYKVALVAADLDTLGDYVLHASAAGADPTDRLLAVVANIEADTYARIGAPAGASVSADVAAVKADSGGLRTDYTTGRAAALDNLDAAVTTRALETTAQLILTESGSHPTLAEIEASTILAKESTSLAIAGYVDTEVGAIQTAVAALPGAAAIADAVWDEPLAGHVTAGSAGNSLSTASSGGVDPTVLADAIWDEALADHAGAGSAGAALAAKLDASGYTAPDNAGIAAVKAKTDNLPASPAAVGSAMTLTTAYDPAKTAATQASVNALWTTAIAEAYAADGAAPTPAQALCMILQLLAEKSVSGTTMTVKKLDGATTAMTFTLNDATAPTSITRAS